jgi:L-ascorbate metabolism protein UlaG (beta-lactamase superfamily)
MVKTGREMKAQYSIIKADFGGFMEIIWYGHSCFRLTERNLATVVCDPYDHRHVGYDSLRLKGDIVTVSHDSPSHNFVQAVKSEPRIINGAGEFEIGGVFITGVQTNGHTKKNEGEPVNTIFLFDYNGVTVLHLGDLNRVPSQTEVEDLGPVNVVLAPIGGVGCLNAAKAAEVISLLEPNIVIPMHFSTPATTLKLDSLQKFLKEMGQEKVETQPSIKITGSGSLPVETRVVVLEYEHNKD